MQLPALAAAHGDAQWLHVQAAAGFMLHLRLRHRVGHRGRIARRLQWGGAAAKAWGKSCLACAYKGQRLQRRWHLFMPRSYCHMSNCQSLCQPSAAVKL